MAQCHKRAFVTPPNKGDSSTRTAPELTRSWSEGRTVQVSPLGHADRIQPPNVEENVALVLNDDDMNRAVQAWSDIPEVTNVAELVRSTLVATKA